MANTNNASKSTKKGWKGTIFIVVLLAAIFAIAKPISNWIAGLGSSFQFESSSWITLIVILAVLGLLIYAVYKMTKKEKPADPHKAPDPHGGGGAAADPHHGKPTKTFLHMFGFFTILFFVVYGAWNMFSSAHKNKEEREAAEEKARLNDPYATHTSNGGASMPKRWKHKSDGTFLLSPDFVIVFVKNPEDSFYAEMHGTDQKIAVEMDTTDILSKLAPAGKGDKDWNGMRVYAFQGVEGKITSVDYKFRTMSTDRAETYIDTIFLKK